MAAQDEFWAVWFASASAVPGNGGTVSGPTGSTDGLTSLTYTASANAGFVFDKWTWLYTGTASIGSPDPTSPQITFSNFKVPEDQSGLLSVNAHFKSAPEYVTITVVASPNEGGTVSGGGTYRYGASFTIYAVPKPGYRFDGWSDSEAGDNPSYTGVARADKVYTAYFVPETGTAHRVTTSVGTPRGTTSGDGLYERGASFTIRAIPYNSDGTQDPGGDRYEFDYWLDQGGNRITTASYTGVMGDADLYYVAHFRKKEKCKVAIKEIAIGGGTGVFRCDLNTSVSGTGEYWPGETCTLIAGANPGTKLVTFFIKSGGNVVHYDDGNATFMVSSDVDVYALSLYEEATFDYKVVDQYWNDADRAIISVSGSGVGTSTKLRPKTEINVSIAISQAYADRYSLSPFYNGKYFSSDMMTEVSGGDTPNMVLMIDGDCREFEEYYDNEFTQGDYYLQKDSYSDSIYFTFVAKSGRRKITYSVKYYRNQFVSASEQSSGQTNNSPSGEFEVDPAKTSTVVITINGSSSAYQAVPPYSFTLQGITSSKGSVSMSGGDMVATVTIPPRTSGESGDETVTISGMIWHQHDGLILYQKSSGDIICKGDGLILCR